MPDDVTAQPGATEPSRKAVTLRSRVRAEMTAEITETARRHLAAHGAPNLSLRAVARDVGMVSSAIYRYFPSRDDLLTTLIVDAYNALGAAVEEAESAVDRSDLPARFEATCRAVRRWAVAHPHEYALTYGSPVPGYVAPTETTGPASRVVTVLLGIIVDGVGAGIVRPLPADWLAPPVQQEMARIVAATAPIPTTVMARAMFVWAALFGAVSFEVFGRLDTIVGDRDAWFDHEVLTMARLVGLRPGVRMARQTPSPPTAIDIRPATQDQLADIATLFGAGKTTTGCYCMWFIASAKQCQAGWDGGNRLAFESMARELSTAATPGPVGLLAYAGGEPVGWCAAGPRARFERASRSPVLKAHDQVDGVWLVPCFFVRRDARGHGITRALLTAAVELARERGAVAVEGFPLAGGNRRAASEAFLGVEPLFASCGFAVVSRPSASRVVMRREL